MNLLSTAQWIEMFKECGYKKVKSWTVGKSKDWGGTLVITGTKN